MAKQFDYESLYHRLEPACGAQMARVLSEVLLEAFGGTESREKETSRERAELLWHRLRRLKWQIALLGVIEAGFLGALSYCLFVGGVRTGFDAYIVSMCLFAALLMVPVTVAILVENLKSTKQELAQIPSESKQEDA